MRTTLHMVGYDRHRVFCSHCGYVEVFDGAPAAIAAYRDHGCEGGIGSERYCGSCDCQTGCQGVDA